MSRACSTNPREYLLPTNVKPLHYDLNLRTNLDDATFKGHEIIDVKVNEPSDEVVVNAVDLKFTSAHFQRDNVKIEAKDFLERKFGQVAIKFNEQLNPGDGKLVISYEGNISKGICGFYRSTWKDTDNQERYFYSTQFENTDARKAFPCWDEPNKKATFKMTIAAPKSMTILANNVALKETIDEQDSNLKVIEFADTPKMSTYLAAWTIADLKYVEKMSKNGTLVRVYATPNNIQHCDFALDAAVKSLEFLEDYFGIPFPLKKLDHIAVPDFKFGAMENWGLITYRERLLIFDKTNTSAALKAQMVLTIAHETVHQWFGNLVTMDWWTQLWLNEGFATFIEFLVSHAIYPEFKALDQVVNEFIRPALAIDSYHNSHQVEAEVKCPDEIESIFDNISYEKGSSVICMIYNFIGGDVFRRALTKYLNKFAYSNAVSEDLWHSLAEESGKPVDSIMESFVKQKGYPLVTCDYRYVNGKGILRLKQKKFTFDGKCPMEDDKLWFIPITVGKVSEPGKIHKSLILSEREKEFEIDGLTENDLIKLNIGFTCFYRVDYGENLKNFLPAIKSGSLSLVDRLNIIDDAFYTYRNGTLSAESFFELLSCFKNEKEALVWQTISGMLGYFSNLVEKNDALHHNYGVWVKDFLGPIWQKIGFDEKPGEDHLETVLRPSLISILAEFNDENIIKESTKRFDNHINETEIIGPNIRTQIYRIVSKHRDDEATHAVLFERYFKTDSNDEQMRLVKALCATQSIKRIQELLDFHFTDKIRLQDAYVVPVYLSQNKVGSQMSWNYFKENTDKYHSMYGPSTFVSEIVETVTGFFASEKEAKEVEDFLASQTRWSSFKLDFGRTVEQIKNREACLKRSESFFAQLSK